MDDVVPSAEVVPRISCAWPLEAGGRQLRWRSRRTLALTSTARAEETAVIYSVTRLLRELQPHAGISTEGSLYTLPFRAVGPRPEDAPAQRRLDDQIRNEIRPLSGRSRDAPLFGKFRTVKTASSAKSRDVTNRWVKPTLTNAARRRSSTERHTKRRGEM